MKKSLPFFLIFVLLLISANLLLPSDTLNSNHNAKHNSSRLAKTQLLDINKTSKAYADTIQPTYYPPKEITIPKIALNANIVAVGLNNQNGMDVPNNFVDVGWYDLGSKPGQQGSAVLDGHYDNFHGQPAVFYYLDTLTSGDKIVITDESGKKLTFTVVDNEIYPVNTLPLQQIFASNNTARLNIITCHGQWDDNIQTYNQRTVIYSVLDNRSSSN